MTASTDEALRDYAVRKARSDPAAKLPYEAQSLSGKGFLFLVHGMYWRDISKVSVDFEKSYTSFDYYHFDRQPSQGHVDLDDKTRRQLITLCNQLWEEKRDHLEQPGEPLRIVGIMHHRQLILVDGKDYRVIPSSVKPLPTTQKLYEEVWRLIGEKVR